MRAVLTPRTAPSYAHIRRVLGRVLDHIALVSVSRGLSASAKAELAACIDDLTVLIARLPRARRTDRKGGTTP
jgi:hypothetical protein